MLCLVAGTPAKAQYGWGKWEVAPFVGFETSGSVPVTNSLTVDGCAPTAAQASAPFSITD
jgi:hypothetical protein